MKEPSTETLRLFAAIAIPERVREEMARIQGELRPLTAPGDVRWTKPEQLHLTLNFFGDVPANAVEALKKSMAEACAGVGHFICAPGASVFFPIPVRHV